MYFETGLNIFRTLVFILLLFLASCGKNDSLDTTKIIISGSQDNLLAATLSKGVIIYALSASTGHSYYLNDDLDTTNNELTLKNGLYRFLAMGANGTSFASTYWCGSGNSGAYYNLEGNDVNVNLSL